MAAEQQFQGRLSGAALGQIAKADKPTLVARVDMLDKMLAAGHEQMHRIEQALDRALGAIPQTGKPCEARQAPNALDTRLIETQDSLTTLVDRLRDAAGRLDSAV